MNTVTNKHTPMQQVIVIARPVPLTRERDDAMGDNGGMLSRETRCRRCGANFTPPEGASGTAAAYRCPECTTFRAFCEDLPYMLCVVQ